MLSPAVKANFLSFFLNPPVTMKKHLLLDNSTPGKFIGSLCYKPQLTISILYSRLELAGITLMFYGKVTLV